MKHSQTPRYSVFSLTSLILRLAITLGICLTLVTLAIVPFNPRLGQAAAGETGHAFRGSGQEITHWAAQRSEIGIDPGSLGRRPGRDDGLRDARDVPTTFIGPEASVRDLKDGSARPVALASGDLDEDGMPDLISGYIGLSTGILTVHRRSIDTVFANPLEAEPPQATSTARSEQRFAPIDHGPSPFLQQARVFTVPEAPEFLGTGDFNADGHVDVVAAARGGYALYLLAGNGLGELRAAERIALPGRVTALTTGEINRADGLVDIVLGIAEATGPKALVFESPEGALKGEPETFDLPAEATALVLGQLDKDYEMDLALAAGRELLIVKGRDRKLSLDEMMRASVPQASINRQSFPFKTRAMSLGNFSGDHQTDLALLSEDGGLRVLEARVKRVKVKRGRREQAWGLETLSPGLWPQASQLVRTRISGRPNDDLVVVNQVSHQLNILTHEAETGGRGVTVSESPVHRVAESVDVEAVAALSMRLNVDT